MKILSLALSACFVISLFTGCSMGNEKPSAILSSRDPFQARTASKESLRALRKLVVAPISIRPSAETAFRYQSQIESDVQRYASGVLGLEVVVGDSVLEQDRQMNLSRGNLSRDWTLSDRSELMKHFGADGFLVVEISRFVERKGSRIGAETAAAVGMRFLVYRSGKDPVWEASYSYRDKALTDDLFSAPRKISGWKTAHALIEDGLQQAFMNLESQRKKSFENS